MAIGEYVTMNGTVKFGKNVIIDHYVSFSGDNEIGDNVTIRLRSTIGQYAKIDDNTYICPSVDILAYDFESGEKKGVTIGKNCIIGCKAVIAPGVNIGDNVIIGACSFVNKDCLEEGKYFGIPARKVS